MRSAAGVGGEALLRVSDSLCVTFDLIKGRWHRKLQYCLLNGTKRERAFFRKVTVEVNSGDPAIFRAVLILPPLNTGRRRLPAERQVSKYLAPGRSEAIHGLCEDSWAVQPTGLLVFSRCPCSHASVARVEVLT